MKKIISIMCLVAMSVGLSACNTIKGVGKDVERGGEKVQDAATDAQRR
ncbi:entericidin A/B family lipoprotein [Herminiimonas fonticola]|uniref:Putative small secreted protein n=1 Tax=Herminiimonas fonticola TaxID=303380 RepID=A0A4R6GHV9_9BURK|nr:entericidin A/B family lipoprotein [Herminiimonas fonticola]RBA25458.1 putative small secreted protein [Herminiimonas fonticola]TDN94571.1 putative small secreted protein [Herminiimonas fonticola]